MWARTESLPESRGTHPSGLPPPPPNALMLLRIRLTFLQHRLPRQSSKKPRLCVGSACPSQHGADLVSLPASAERGVQLFGRTWEETGGVGQNLRQKLSFFFKACIGAWK